ncbi:MAG: ABC transporter ATP-binding protein [Ignavibacteria bacterium]|jgi:lipoprotein-releasing system ATP-binding protein
MNNIIIEAESLFKSFTKSKFKKVDVLYDLSLQIEANKSTMIVGASGAGKSTLLHILAGLDFPDSGTVKFNNENIYEFDDKKLSAFRNQNFGVVFQFHHLLPEFTAVENTAIPMMINGTNQKEAFKRSVELLELVGLKDRTDHKPAELSGGEAQRVAIARALVNEPQILFADEPTGNLDSKTSTSIHQLFEELKEKLKITMLIVTHNKELVKLADNVLEMKDGKIVNL